MGSPKQTWTALVLWIAAFAIVSSYDGWAGERPNIVVILADDFGYGSATCYGANRELVQTPSLDRLAKEGVRFTDANTTSSVCSPTRYSLLTGRYCWRTSLKHQVLNTFAPLHIETTRLNMASLLKRHGYGTAAIGKWHLGYGKGDETPQWRTDYTAELSPGPLDIGFDYHFGVPSNHGDLTGVYVENRYVYGLSSGKVPEGMTIAGPAAGSEDYQATYEAKDTEGGKGGDRILKLDAPRRKNERVMKVLTDKATGWLRQQPKDRPFFLYFTPVAVHNPVTPDRDIAGQSKAGPYGDWIHELDRSVGRILETLDAMGVADNTLVLFTSDNGGVFKPEREMLQTDAYRAGLKVNGDLRGGKHDVWEGGFKVPFLIRWPGKAKGGSVNHAMVSVADLLATTAAIVGEELPKASEAAEDSYSFLPAIVTGENGTEAKTAERKELIVHSASGVFAIRRGAWKWVEGIPVDDIKPGARKTQDDQFRAQLYNTHDDPSETRDVSDKHPEVVAELRGLLDRYRDGGYSRELPPQVADGINGAANKNVPAAKWPAQTGELLFREPLTTLPVKPWVASGGAWEGIDGGLWGKPAAEAQRPASLRRPMVLGDGSIGYEVSFRGANRTSLRIDCGERGGSIRVVISRSFVEVARNPLPGEAASSVEVLARKPLRLAPATWHPVRITFKGKEVTVQIAETVINGQSDIIRETKLAMNLLVFGPMAGFRDLKVTKD